MDIRIQISDTKLTSFTSESKQELGSVLYGIADAIVDEAARIERSERGDGKSGEIVRNDVTKAASLFSRYIERRKSTRVFIACEMGSTISAILAGIMLPQYNISVFFLITGVVFLIFAVVLSLYLIMKKNN